MNGIVMRAGRVSVPFAGQEDLHLAVHDFHRQGALIVGAGKASFGGKRVGEREQHADEKSHSHEQLDHERAA